MRGYSWDDVIDDGPEPTQWCPECDEKTLCVGETKSFYQDGMKVSPDETMVWCDSCGFKDVV